MINTIIVELIDAGALFVVNHSGGKDSQAMYLKLAEIVPADQLIVVHAHLPGVEWEGTIDHIRKTIRHPLHVVTATKTFFEMVERRGMFPSPSTRQCTSDLKRGPIEKFIRHYLKDNPQFAGRVVSCMGLRAQESPARARRETLRLSDRNSKAGRAWYDWLPIHDMLVQNVFRTIKMFGQKPHWAYEAGMTRLSCCFCIMSSRADLRTAARLRPDLLKKYSELETLTGQVMMMPAKGVKRSLAQICGEGS